MLGGKTDHLIRERSDDWQEGYAQSQLGQKALDGHCGIDEDAEQHDRHQEAGAAAGMIGGILLRVGDAGHAVVLKSKNDFVFSAVIVVDPFYVVKHREAPDE